MGAWTSGASTACAAGRAALNARETATRARAGVSTQHGQHLSVTTPTAGQAAADTRGELSPAPRKSKCCVVVTAESAS